MSIPGFTEVIVISYVIPAYNEESTIFACLESIYREIAYNRYHSEVIVVNNNSSDKTVEVVLQNFPQVKLIHEKKPGVVAARKAGYKAARGVYIANIDADTIMPIGWVESAIGYFWTNSKVVAVTGPYDYYDIPPFKRMVVHLYYKMAVIPYFFAKHVFKSGSMLTGGNSLILKEALDKCDPYPDTYTFYGEDTELARQLSTVGSVVFKNHHKIFTSGRRLLQQGIFSTGFHYVMNYIWPMLFKRPYTKQWKNYR